MVTHNSDSNISGRVGKIENHYIALEGRMQAVEDTLVKHGGKLDEIIAALGRHRDFDPVRVLQFIALAVGVVAAIGTAITYVSTSTNAGRLAVLEFQTREIWATGGWARRKTSAD